MFGIVYLIAAANGDNLSYKIGKTSRRASNRKKEISTANAGSLTVIFEYKTKNVHALEKAVQLFFGAHHIQGEWFNSELDVSKFIEVCEMYENSMNALKENENYYLTKKNGA